MWRVIVLLALFAVAQVLNASWDYFISPEISKNIAIDQLKQDRITMIEARSWNHVTPLVKTGIWGGWAVVSLLVLVNPIKKVVGKLYE